MASGRRIIVCCFQSGDDSICVTMIESYRPGLYEYFIRTFRFQDSSSEDFIERGHSGGAEVLALAVTPILPKGHAQIYAEEKYSSNEGTAFQHVRPVTRILGSTKFTGELK